MARSCTPPPLSDRKRIVADAHRRRSLAVASSSAFPKQTSASDDNQEQDPSEDEMSIHDTPSGNLNRGRGARRSVGGGSPRMSVIAADAPLEAGPSARTYPKASRTVASSVNHYSSSHPKSTSEQRQDSNALPTWTPLPVSNGSESSEQEGSPTSTSLKDELHSTTSESAHRSPITPYNPAKQFRFPKDIIRWLPPAVHGASYTDGYNAGVGGDADTRQHVKSSADLGGVNEMAGTNRNNTLPSLATSVPKIGPSITSLRTQALPSRNKSTSASVERILPTSSSDSRSAPKSNRGPRPVAKKMTGGRPPKPLTSASANGEVWTTEFVKALKRSFNTARTGPEAQSQELEQHPTRGHVASNRKAVSRKGKEKADPPPETELSDTDASVDVEALSEEDLGDAQESYELSSPAIPHPALPEDSFEDSIWIDEEDPPLVLSSSRSIALNIKVSAKRQTSSLWLDPSDNGNIFESQSAYFVGRNPSRGEVRDKGKRKEVLRPPISPSRTVLAKRKRTYSSASVASSNARAEVEAFANAMTSNSHDADLSLSSYRQGSRAAIEDPPAKTRRHTIANAHMPASGSLSKRAMVRQPPLSEHEDSEELVEELLDGDTEWYLDLETVTWRRRISGQFSSEAQFVPAPPSVFRLDAGPSSAAPVNSPSNIGRGRGRPRLSDELKKPSHRPTGRPTGRPRKHPPDESPSHGKTGRPKGRPRKYPPGEAPKKSTGRPRGRPRKHPLPSTSASNGLAVLGSLVNAVVGGTSKSPTGLSQDSCDESNVVAGSSAVTGVIDSTAIREKHSELVRASTSTPVPPTGIVAQPVSDSPPVPLPTGATSESEGSTLTLVQPARTHVDHPVHNDQQFPGQPDEKMDEYEDDDDDDVVEYLDLSTWGQAQEIPAPAPVLPAPVDPPPPLSAAAPLMPLPAPAPVSFPIPEAYQHEYSIFIPQPSNYHTQTQLGHVPVLYQLSDIQQPPFSPHYRQPYPQAPPRPPSPPSVAPVPDEGIPDYQSSEALMASLISYATDDSTLSPRGGVSRLDTAQKAHEQGPYFVGSYAVIIDEKTNVTESFVRKIGTEVRRSLREKTKWNFRASPISQAISNIDSIQHITLSYTCTCPHRPYLPDPLYPTQHIKSKTCGGIVSISAQEVTSGKKYDGIKGVKITIRVQH